MPHSAEEASYEAFRRAFERAAQRVGPQLCRFGYRLGGRPVSLRVAGPELAEQIHAALAHLADPDAREDAAALQIDVWDERACGIDRHAEPGALEPARSEPLRTSPDTRFVGQRLPETLTWLDRRREHLVGCVADRKGLSNYERSRPFESPLLLWLRDRGVALVHAGLVAHAGQGALFLGRSGAGKSSCVAACVDAGMALLSDDKVAFSPLPGGGFQGHALNGSLLLDEDSLAQFPHFRQGAEPPRRWVDRKSLVPTCKLAASSLAGEVSIDLLCLPRRGRATRALASPASRRDALLSASLATLLAFPIDRAHSLEHLAELVESVPAYWLDLGPDRREAPALVRELLAKGSKEGMDP